MRHEKINVILTIILLPTIAFATGPFQSSLIIPPAKKCFTCFTGLIIPMLNWPHPFNLAGGELEASETVDLKVNYQNGKYYVIWSDDADWQNKVMMNVNDDVKSVIVTPIKSSMKK